VRASSSDLRWMLTALAFVGLLLVANVARVSHSISSGRSGIGSVTSPAGNSHVGAACASPVCGRGV